MERINPYYNPDKLGLELLSFDEPDMSYEYNTLCFWKTENGLIFTASDSGCSCPTPFENYEGETQKEVIQQLERVGTEEQALSIFDSWNKNYEGKPHLGIEDRKRLSEWMDEPYKGER